MYLGLVFWSFCLYFGFVSFWLFLFVVGLFGFFCCSYWVYPMAKLYLHDSKSISFLKAKIYTLEA